MRVANTIYKTRAVLAVLIMALTAFCAAGQTMAGRVAVSDVAFSVEDGVMTVAFAAEVPRGTVKGNEVLLFRPVITDGTFSVSLPLAAVYGGRRAESNFARRRWASGDDTSPDSIRAVRCGKKMDYSASVPVQYWMRGARIEIESAVKGCSCVSYGTPETLALSILVDVIPELRDSVITISRMEGPPPFIPQTLADTLSLSFPFVVRDEGFDHRKPFDIYDDERDNSLAVYFHKGSGSIDLHYSDNAQTLKNMVAAIDMIERAPGCGVTHVVVSGFASPEGSLWLNSRLAWSRAVAVKEYILRNTAMKDESVVIFNGSEDWRGLRMLVAASEMDHRDEVLGIIDDVSAQDPSNPDGWLEKLKLLHGGDQYRYMMHEMFPLLRTGAFIKVYYTNQ